jgi:hypothetical protein
MLQKNKCGVTGLKSCVFEVFSRVCKSSGESLKMCWENFNFGSINGLDSNLHSAASQHSYCSRIGNTSTVDPIIL